ncbi:hypothetical protein [Actinomyces ruminis]|uniref:hypothetical protein n=1 Tax=Actinomyces ruminis TaxID=1937003 RepID=UPI001178C250|nr:hypothetical protein [Actinomyces ruminis]
MDPRQPRRTVPLADIPRGLQKLIDDGTLTFQFDKTGEILPTLINQHKRYEHTIRLEELTLTPDLAGARANLATQIALNQVLAELDDLRSIIASITEGLQDDRLALVESAWYQFEQARSIRSARQREARLMEAQTRAIDGRTQLTASIRRDLDFLTSKMHPGALQTAKDAINPNSRPTNAATAERLFIALEQVTRATQIEAATYLILGEPEAARTALRQFTRTIEDLDLHEHETLLALNSFTERDMHRVINILHEAHTNATSFLADQNGPTQTIHPPPGIEQCAVPTIPSETISPDSEDNTAIQYHAPTSHTKDHDEHSS